MSPDVPAIRLHGMEILPAASEKHTSSMTTQLLFALGMGRQVVPSGTAVPPDHVFGAVAGSLVVSNFPGATSVNFTAIEAAPFRFASDGITAFWLIFGPPGKLTFFFPPWVIGCGGVLMTRRTPTR